MRHLNLVSGSLIAAAMGMGVSLSPAERATGRIMRAPDGHEPRDPEVIAADLVKQVKTATDETKAVAEKAVADVKQFGEMSTDAKKAADEALVKMNGLQSQLDAFGQTIDRLKGAGASDEELKSLGSQFVETEAFKSLKDSGDQRGKAAMEVKATITLATDGNAGAAGVGAAPTRLPGILGIPQRKLTIRDLISPGQMDGNALQYVRQSGFTNNAGMVAEGARKPQSDLKLELVDTTAKVIAHYMKASRQVIEDVSQLRSLIDSHLLYGLAFREEAQILFGDGTGQNLLGIVPQASDYTGDREDELKTMAGAARTANALDRIRLAILQGVLAEFPATGIVLNPIDLALIELITDDMGRYVVGNVAGAGPQSLWRLPVVDTPAMTAGRFLTGAFRLGAQLFDRWVARVQLATENEDDFVNNLVTILAEERVALAVYRPEAFVEGPVWGAVA